jgi:hypothetical protein
MSPAHVEAGRSIKNAVANKAILHSKKLVCAYWDPIFRGERWGSVSSGITR